MSTLYIYLCHHVQPFNNKPIVTACTESHPLLLSPALGLAFAPLGSRGLHYETIKLDLNMYTGPGYLGALLGVANILLLIIVFKEYKLFPQKKKKQGKQMKKVFGGELIASAYRYIPEALGCFLLLYSSAVLPPRLCGLCGPRLRPVRPTGSLCYHHPVLLHPLCLFRI